MTPNSDAKFEEEPTCRCKNDMRNLANFHASTQKPSNLHFDGFFVQSVLMYELKNYRRVLCNNTEEWCKNWSGIDLPFEKWHKEIGEYWPQALEIGLKICTLMGLFFRNYKTFDLKNYRAVKCDNNEKWCKIWKKTDLWFKKWHEWGIG